MNYNAVHPGIKWRHSVVQVVVSKSRKERIDEGILGNGKVAGGGTKASKCSANIGTVQLRSALWDILRGFAKLKKFQKS